ncbi:FAD/NAD(P)-binding domain-containing protein [Agrocybe pediades]|nr:FAD/NAD(P)-binding domain-containing protein [Agrocybe pediades]
MPTGSAPSAVSPPTNVEHPRLSKPIHDSRRLKVIAIGAGCSGLLIAYKLQRSFENYELVVYEKNEDLGGTWHENRYPGCGCDVPAHTYTWSFEPKADWSAFYAGANEIHDYFKTVAVKYDLEKYIKYNHRVSRAEWNNRDGQWEVQVVDGDGNTKEDSCHILINASGLLNSWKWPDIDGLHDFKGALLHTARWDTSLDLSGKNVGLIGNGSSAIQVLPAVAPIVDKVTTFIRSPAWVSPVHGQDQHIYTEEQIKTWSNDPQAHLHYRKIVETQFSGIWPIFFKDSEMQKMTAAGISQMMKDKLNNKKLEEVLIPSTFGVGCRRITPGVGYLEAMGSEMVDVVVGDIQKITERGVVGGDGVERPVDILICATGFDTTSVPRFPIIGLDGKDIREEWKDESESYFGIATNGFPNYFMIVGPSSPVAGGPVLVTFESQVDYILKLANRWQTENIHYVQPRMGAIKEFVEHRNAFMKNMVWSQNCRSWYKNKAAADGNVTVIWPGSTLHFLEAMADPRYEDWEFKYQGNRFAYLGNGYSQTESDPESDWAHYIRNQDDGPYLSRVKQLRAMNRKGRVVQPIPPENGVKLL